MNIIALRSSLKNLETNVTDQDQALSIGVEGVSEMFGVRAASGPTSLIMALPPAVEIRNRALIE